VLLIYNFEVHIVFVCCLSGVSISREELGNCCSLRLTHLLGVLKEDPFDLFFTVALFVGKRAIVRDEFANVEGVHECIEVEIIDLCLPAQLLSALIFDFG